MLAGVGFSLLMPEQEVAYARMTDIRVRATSNKVRRTLEWCCKSLQVTPKDQVVTAEYVVQSFVNLCR